MIDFTGSWHCKAVLAPSGPGSTAQQQAFTIFSIRVRFLMPGPVADARGIRKRLGYRVSHERHFTNAYLQSPPSTARTVTTGRGALAVGPPVACDLCELQTG